jgi:predicted methyltransferase
MRSKLFVRAAIVTASFSLASWAVAFDTGKLGQQGSVTLDDLLPLFEKTPALKREVDQALVESKKKAEDVLCDGMRFPGSWENLAGVRVSPYFCEFEGKWLQVRADVRVVGRKGRVFQSVNRDAMKNAEDVQERNLKWSWSTQRPPER